MEYCVVGNGIDKSYAAKKVLDNVDIHVPMHKIFGLIGPNGAGKSTLLKCIMNLIRLDGGNIQVFDNPAGMEKHELNRTGSLIEYPYFYDDLTGTENLLIHSRYMGYYDIKRIDEVLDKVDLTKDAKKKVINYSMGMRQRLAIARAILIKPELLILDEPINALDPEGIKKMRELFIQLNAELGTTIIISSHILSEMDFLASDIGIMSNGKLIEEKTLKEIHQENKDKIVARVDDLSKATIILEERGIQNFKVIDDGQIQIFDLTYDTSYFSELFIQNRLKLYQIDVVKKTLEEYFFEVVGGN
ncbi:MAG: ATP-binding cassette domain-containing protein [Lachnospiraceae bacterium]|nr:ATP-binding cassette domain-containing protein [Lachnospiraceae bacterium]